MTNRALLRHRRSKIKMIRDAWNNMNIVTPGYPDYCHVTPELDEKLLEVDINVLEWLNLGIRIIEEELNRED